jgi:hypothetical protein
MNRVVYREIASALNAMRSCEQHHSEPGKSHLKEWIERHLDRALDLTKEYLPSGSGFDNGTSLDVDACRDDKLVFVTAFRHMNDAGYYDGWTDHKVTVRPSLVHTIKINVSGRDRNEIKDYIADAFDIALRSTFSE